ncbi:MAG TPA: hypothetical protein VIL33_06825 [Rhodothermia bacterium]
MKGRLMLCAVLVGAAGGSWNVEAQDLGPRFGLGVGLVANPTDDDLANDDVGLAVRGRISKPLNSDVSLAGTVGFYAFVFNGTDTADYILNPEVSAIVTLNGQNRFPYLLVGAGGLFPTDGDEEARFEAHAGYGLVWPLTSASVFLEVTPTLAFQPSGTTFVIPVAVGMIF